LAKTSDAQPVTVNGAVALQKLYCRVDVGNNFGVPKVLAWGGAIG